MLRTMLSVFLLFILSGCRCFGASSSTSLTVGQKAQRCNEQFKKNVEDVLMQVPWFEQAYVMEFDLKRGQKPISVGPVAMRTLIDTVLLHKFYKAAARVKRNNYIAPLEIAGKELVTSLKRTIADYAALDNRCNKEMEKLSVEEVTNDAVFWAIFKKSNYIFIYFNCTIPVILQRQLGL